MVGNHLVAEDKSGIILTGLSEVTNPHLSPVTGSIVLWKRWNLTVLLFALSPFSERLWASVQNRLWGIPFNYRGWPFDSHFIHKLKSFAFFVNKKALLASCILFSIFHLFSDDRV